MSKREKIFETIKNKACVKQEVYAQSKKVFLVVKEVLNTISADYQEFVQKVDTRVLINYKDQGDFASSISFGGDELLFNMHSNVFTFEPNHPVLAHSEIRKDASLGFFGVINVYNFLADSFRFQRDNDLGFLVCRIFINKNGCLFVEGKGDVGMNFNDLYNQPVSKALITDIIESCIQFSLDFDMYTPKFDAVQLVSVGQMKLIAKSNKTVTAKRLGFKMSTIETGGKKK